MTTKLRGRTRLATSVASDTNPDNARVFVSRHGFSYKSHKRAKSDVVDWPAPGLEDTELGVFMEPEVCHGAQEIYARVQA